MKAATSRIHALQTDGLPRFDALYGNFHDAKALLEGIGIEKIDGALLDLGVSSYQLDEGSRGFSYHADAPLDMRMDRRQALTAAVIVNEWPENEIARVIRDWGEENWAVQIARVICDRRKLKRIETTGDLVSIIDAAIPKKFREKDGSHPARRTFQGLRIAVNDELALARERAARHRVAAQSRRTAVRHRVSLAGGSRGQEHLQIADRAVRLPEILPRVRVRPRRDGQGGHPQTDHGLRGGAGREPARPQRHTAHH